MRAQPARHAYGLRALDRSGEVTESKQLAPLPLEFDALQALVGYCPSIFLSRHLAAHVTTLQIDALPGEARMVFFYKSRFNMTLPGRRGFTVRVTPQRNPPSASVPAMMTMLSSLRGVPSLRQSVWFKRTPAQELAESGEIVMALCIQGAQGDPALGTRHMVAMDVLLVQPHLPCEPKVVQKGSRCGLEEADVPMDVAHAGAAAVDQYLLDHGSKVLSGGSSRVPISAYHPVVHADEVYLASGYDMFFLSPACIVGVADVVPVFAQHTSPACTVHEVAFNLEGVPVPRPALLRAYSR